GMGPAALAANLGITKAEAERIINDRYMSKYKGVKRWIDNQHRFVHQNGYVTTATGRRRHLPTGMKDKNEYYGEVAAAERQAQNCVDAETEILTVDGWKRYDEISEGTVLLTKNP